MFTVLFVLSVGNSVCTYYKRSTDDNNILIPSTDVDLEIKTRH
jgi:hypothetical protein